jgi:hypothetical protein
MAGFSDYLEAAVLNHIFRTSTLAKPTNVYVSLHSADPGDTGTSELVSSGSYARVAVTSADASWSAPADSGTSKQIANAASVTFPTPTIDWGTITHFGLWDAPTNGNFLGGGALGTSRAVLSGDVAPQFGIGALTVSLG